MNIKTFLLIIALAIFFICSQPLVAKKGKTLDFDYSAGINLTYSRIDIEVGDENVNNTLDFYYAAVQVNVDVLDYVTVALVAGFNSNSLTDGIEVVDFPLSLRVGDERFNSMVFGFRSRAELFSLDYFTFTPRVELLFFTQHTKELPIELPVTLGTAEIKNSFSQLGLDLLVQYDGFDNFSLFAGPRLNLVSGKMNIKETISSLSGATERKYNQRRAVGLTAGVFYELGNNFDVYASVSLFSETSLSVSIFYVF